MEPIVYLDLFSGVGGFAKGFEDAGVKIKEHYFSEIDKHAIAVYKNNFQNAKYVGSVTDVSANNLPKKPNIITFGFPCQDLSVAGKGEGLTGQRSGLFFEAVRIVKECLPEVFVFENVKGLLSSNEGKDFETVLRTIADLGFYECEWQLVNTSWVLPQNRERVFFVGHLSGSSLGKVFPFTEDDTVFSEKKTTKTRQPQTKHGTTIKADDTFIEIPKKAGCLTGGGNSGGLHSDMTVTPGTLRTHNDGKGFRAIESGNAPTIPARAREDGSGQPVIEIRPVLTINRKEKRQNGRRFKEAGEPAFTLNCQDQYGVMIDMKVANCVTPDAYLAKGERKRDQNGKAVLTSMHERRIRRLTEIECERLQGFPDNWTEYGDYDREIKKVPSTQRYRQMGNAITTIWAKLIAERLYFSKKHTL